MFVEAELAPMPELCRRAQEQDNPADALGAINALRDRLAELERRHVASMLEEEATWTQIAEALGISRQAAHSRFRHIPRPKPRSKAPLKAEVERILVTGVARETVRRAAREATDLGAQAIGTEHLLLALLSDAPQAVTQILENAGADEQTLRDALQPTIIENGNESENQTGFTAYAREVLEGSLREAVERGDGFIGADHLLLALLRKPEGGAAQTLEALAVDPSELYAALRSQPRTPAAPMDQAPG